MKDESENVFDIQRDEQYGDFKAVERLSAARGLYRVECVRCGASRRYLSDDLGENPMHDCDDRVAEINKIRRDLAVQVEAMDDDEDDEIKSLFALDLEMISGFIRELEEDTGGSDSGRRFQITTLKMMVDLIPIAEITYRNDPRQSNSFSLNALLAQAGEIINALKATEDTQAIVERVLSRNLQPGFLQIGQILIDGVYGLRREIEPYLKPEVQERAVAKFEERLKEMAAAAQAVYFRTMEKVSDELSEG